MRELALIGLILGVLNFAAFSLVSREIGGDAVNGDASCSHLPGKYFLWDKFRPSPCHEVSRAVYLYSKVHTWSLFVSHPLGIAGAIYLWYRKQREKDRDLSA
jgi:hypothetical protein